MAKTNPNGANQYKVDPRQALFLSYYLDNKSETFSNAYRSALRAGYESEYARNITSTMPSWLAEYLDHSSLVKKAEKNLKEMLEMEVENEGVSKSGEVYEYDDVGKLRVKADLTKFVLERLDKERYSQRQEIGAGSGVKKLVIEFDDGNSKEETDENKSSVGKSEEQDEDNS